MFILGLLIAAALVYIAMQQSKKSAPQPHRERPRPNRPATPQRQASSAPQARTSTVIPPEAFPSVAAEIREGVTQPERQAAAIAESAPLPARLPLKTKQWFFSRSEASFFAMLEFALPSGYRVFPNVRLNDLFQITEREYRAKQSVLGRLRDKHVDFLIVSLPDHKPVLAIELDGKSHDNETQQKRDATKDLAFRSAGLPLLRLRAEEAHTPASLSRHLEAAGLLGERRTVA